MSHRKWQIGDVTVTCIEELEVTGLSKFLLPQATEEEALKIDWLQPHFANEKGELVMAIQALVVKTPDLTIVVDTCIGNDKPRAVPPWNKMQTAFLDDFKAAGFDPDGVDIVLCTHLHVDHVGWNTMLVDGKWVPTFPNARYLFARTEYDHAMSDEDAENQQVMSDSVTPVFEAGLVELVETTHRVSDHVSLVPTHGHTPGHVSILIESKEDSALITGDFVHHPCQMAHPDWCSTFDTGPDEAVKTRERIFGIYEGTQTLIIGTHFAKPTAGHVVRDGPVWKLKV